MSRRISRAAWPLCVAAAASFAAVLAMPAGPVAGLPLPGAPDLPQTNVHKAQTKAKKKSAQQCRAYCDSLCASKPAGICTQQCQDRCMQQ